MIRLRHLVLLIGLWVLDAKSGTVKVAAVQTHSTMGAVAANVARLDDLILRAAAAGAKIVVTPECSVQGYMDAENGVSWVRDEAEGAPGRVWGVAEAVPGGMTDHFGRIARTSGAYVCIGLIEKSGTNLFNSQVLLAPDGRIAAHHRKRNLWPPGDSGWATKGDRPLQVVETEYGRLGLMICYDVHTLLWKHREARTDILLWSVGWYGPNTEQWFSDSMPKTVARDAHFAVVAANWSSGEGAAGWPGRGFSVVIGGRGEVIGVSRREAGTDIVYGEVETGRTTPPAEPSARGAPEPQAPAEQKSSLR